MTLVDLLNSTLPVIIQDDYRTYPYLINSNSIELLDENDDGVYILPDQEVVLDTSGAMLFKVEDGDPLWFYLLVTKPLTNEMILLCTVGIKPEDL